MIFFDIRSKIHSYLLKNRYDPLAMTELRANDLHDLSQSKVKVPLYDVPKIEEPEYSYLLPSDPDTQEVSRSFKRRKSSDRLRPTASKERATVTSTYCSRTSLSSFTYHSSHSSHLHNSYHSLISHTFTHNNATRILRDT